MKSRIFVLVVMLLIFITSCKKNTGFSPDLFPVKTGDLWGYVDKDGKEVIKAQFAEADYFCCGLALVKVDDKYGYIDEEGKIVVKAIYKYALPFSEDMACVVQKDSTPEYINTKGERVFILSDAEEAGSFHNGLAKFKNDEGKWGYSGKDGSVKIKPIFDDAFDFSSEAAAVKIFGEDDGEAMWGYINTDGSYIVKPKYAETGPFTGEYAKIKEGDLYGYINKKGEYLIKPKYIDALDFLNGSAPVCDEKGWGFIDEKGNSLVSTQFEGALYYSDDLALVAQNGKCGFIDKDGKFKIGATYDEAGMFMNGLAIVNSGGKYGFIDSDGKYLVQPAYDEVDIMSAAFYTAFGAGYSFYKNTVLSDMNTVSVPAEDVVTEFVTALTKSDSVTAMSLSTAESRNFVNFACSVNQMAASVAGTEVKIENMNCTESGNNAKCEYLENDEPKTINLVKKKGKWLVDMSSLAVS